jgi:hypothetical protein
MYIALMVLIQAIFQLGLQMEKVWINGLFKIHCT